MTESVSRIVNGLNLTREDSSAQTARQAEFEELAAEWKRDTAHLSSPTSIAQHPAYQAIIGMGQDAIPMILRDLQGGPSHWFWALASIARESPVRDEERGDVDAMAAAWLDWGKQRRYIS